MKIVEKTGKTVDEAVTACLTELGVDRDSVTVEVVEEPSKGILGLFGGKLAKVRVTLVESPAEIALEFLNQLTVAMTVEAKFDVSEVENGIRINITGSDLGILIGRRGDTLDSLQFLTNLTVGRRLTERVRIFLDVEGYRKRREETLISLASRLADKVKRTGVRVVLEPMNAHERRIIHSALQDEWKIATFSEGDEPYRRVVIAPKRPARDTGSSY
jgi:spoIIIJ-associated protein